MPAEIQVHNCMNLAGRGAVLIGFVRSGTPAEGQTLAPRMLGNKTTRRLEVTGVERLSSMGSGLPAVGLTFKSPPPLYELQLALPAGSVVELEDAA